MKNWKNIRKKLKDRNDLINKKDFNNSSSNSNRSPKKRLELGEGLWIVVPMEHNKRLKYSFSNFYYKIIG